MNQEALFVKLLSENGQLPKRCSEFAAGYDLYSAENVTIYSHEQKMIATDISIKVPNGYYGRVAPRSGLAFKNMIDVMAGVIDSDYRGNVKVILINHSNCDFIVNKGDRIAQLILEKIITPDVVLTNELDDTDRNFGGFGSTGK